MTFVLIEKLGELNGHVRLKYGSAINDPLPFILTVTPQYVAHATSKTLPITIQEIQDYINKNAERLRQIAENCKERGKNAEVLE
jgi:hypothetical protein